ncbi:phosphogluconate dehydrogenase [Streptomyces rimosus subsp. pseudoverticillatus]|uniref:NAD(P)-dependent oxidoreductase n=1 Tax=Streptomyces rimosus TaxID=1927 RepID=UPI0006B2A941|nr:NAD(P)-dependent oxidoreductase [Streptomyces rimosus]KOT90375.1 phosphogluconate dehydrogenase [Streptomyces rimosus subsp. pseudoverticillatus]
MTVVGVLHPGSMGAAVAAEARLGATEVLWCPTGRSSATKDRALRYGLTAATDLRELIDRADVIFAICPPANAEDVATQVSAHAFTGIYVDGNAISPATMARVAAIAARGGATVVDASIIGSPPSDSKFPRLYLSGPSDALASVASLFTGSAVRTHALSDGIGRASALKLSYSSYQKTSRVLAAVSYALARDYGVQEELLDIAQGRTNSYLAETDYIPKVAARSWRWGPEMEEVAATLRETGLPAELAEASATVMARWGELRDSPLSIPAALEHLHDAPEGQSD